MGATGPGRVVGREGGERQRQGRRGIKGGKRVRGGKKR